VSELDDRAFKTVIRIFLIADMRGFTRFTQEQGDEAAADLASTFGVTARDVAASLRGHAFRAPRR
jgi:class 3 adenylate cyclase